MRTLLHILFSLGFTISLLAQSSQPIVTQWRSPDGKAPMSYLEWKAQWEAKAKKMGGTVMYRSAGPVQAARDSFYFGKDYAYFKGFVRYSDNRLCEDLPPTTSFIVMLNGDDRKILTDAAPRWCFGDPNISGKGYYGIELGNFSDPEVKVGDSFTVVFTAYQEERGEQGQHTDMVTGIPLPPAFPTFLQLRPADIPAPPNHIEFVREAASIKLSWQQQPGRSYSLYRRCLQDTLVLNFPRCQYEKIAAAIIDSTFIDTTIEPGNSYGYILFAKSESSGCTSGHSLEVREQQDPVNMRAIFIQPELLPAIETNVMQLVQDWQNEGAEVIVYARQFVDHQAMRDTLKSITHLKGALLIGDFPVPWFQVSKQDEGGYNYQEYPVDLYYMDLNGTWQDIFHKGPDGALVGGPDGIFDTHTADFPRATEAPEIVIGRITPTPGMGDAATIINFYLDKCHRYRYDIGAIRQDFKALAYVDDDWRDWGHDIARDYLSQVYGEFLCVNDINQTRATDYAVRLDDHYSLIHVWVHSWSGGHSFKITDGTANDYFYNRDILPANSNANFYHLFACGNSRYVEDNNCAAIYAFRTEAGINTIGSTHSGGMLDYDYFYPALATGISFGQAFLQTFQHVGNGRFTEDARGWYYGLSFNGDPFIIPQSSTISNITEISNPVKLALTNYPNPFNTATVIHYHLPSACYVDLTIYNAIGQKIRVFDQVYQSAGDHAITWDGLNQNGDLAASGVYFYRLQAGDRVETNKMILIK